MISWVGTASLKPETARATCREAPEVCNSEAQGPQGPQLVRSDYGRQPIHHKQRKAKSGQAYKTARQKKSGRSGRDDSLIKT